jgi:curved DNA-binding protein CbpA
MQEHYDRLGISPGATPAAIKAAYHGKLKEFPAHQHPQEFKAIRSAYEALQKGKQQTDQDFFEIVSLQVEPNPEVLKQLRQRVVAQAEVSLDELLRLTF